MKSVLINSKDFVEIGDVENAPRQISLVKLVDDADLSKDDGIELKVFYYDKDEAGMAVEKETTLIRYFSQYFDTRDWNLKVGPIAQTGGLNVFALKVHARLVSKREGAEGRLFYL